MRGKHGSNADARSITRITPAGAGKTGPNPIKRFCVQDHPRRCGENRKQHDRRHGAGGSPPQVRGKLRYLIIQYAQARITPAGAGKTRFQEAFFSAARDHPRRCGENSMPSFRTIASQGSPPQVRGKQKPIAGAFWAAGITPAGAGKTWVQGGGF